jgi:hypothetical protein
MDSIIPLEIVDNIYFTVNVGVGTPAANGTLLVMDSLPYMSIVGPNCLTCGAASFYDPASSSTYVAGSAFNIDIFNLTLNSTLGFDTVCLWGATADGDLCID